MVDDEAESRLVEGVEDIAGLDERFFVVNDMHGLLTAPDRYLVCRRDNVYGAATVVAHFAAFDDAHSCAKLLSEYDKNTGSQRMNRGGINSI